MKLNPLMLAVVLAGANAAARAQQEAPAAAGQRPAIVLTAEGLNQRYEFVGNLIDRSSSARQIEKSGTPEAKKIQQDARDVRERAKQSLGSGQLDGADLLLREATQLMMKAVRLAHPEEASAEKVRVDFNSRRDSVKTLLTTGKRVAGEKGTVRPEFARAESLLKEADALAAAGKHGDGRVRLDQAYALIKDAVRGMRSGEELTADKNFATKADEYKYEQDRNDDYQGLIAGVVKGQTDPTWEEAAKKGRQLREEAEALNKAGDVEAALRRINDSTNQLKSILRRAGFPII